MKKIIFLLSTISGMSRAEVMLSYQHKISVDHLERPYNGLVQAQNREPDLQKLLVGIPIFDGSVPLPIYGLCPPHKPENDRKGCRINVTQHPKPADGLAMSSPVQHLIPAAMKKSKLLRH